MSIFLTILLWIARILGWLLAGVAGLFLLTLLLLGSIKLTLRVGYCNKPFASVKIAFFTFSLTDNKRAAGQKKPKKPKAETPAPKKSAEKRKHKPRHKRVIPKAQKPSLTDVIRSFYELLQALLGGFARQVRVETLRLRVLVATDDAAKTALLYGTVSGLLTPVEALAENARRIDRKQVCLGAECDFLADKPEVDAELCISVRIWRLLLLTLCALPKILRALKTVRNFTAETATEDTPEQIQEKEGITT